MDHFSSSPEICMLKVKGTIVFLLWMCVFLFGHDIFLQLAYSCLAFVVFTFFTTPSLHFRSSCFNFNKEMTFNLKALLYQSVLIVSSESLRKWNERVAQDFNVFNISYSPFESMHFNIKTVIFCRLLPTGSVFLS